MEKVAFVQIIIAIIALNYIKKRIEVSGFDSIRFNLKSSSWEIAKLYFHLVIIWSVLNLIFKEPIYAILLTKNDGIVFVLLDCALLVLCILLYQGLSFLALRALN